MEKVQRSNLHLWDRNPRSIQEGDFTRLKDQITLLGQYKPLLSMRDGTILGGNMRLRALEALGQDEVWVAYIDYVEEDGLYYAVINGEKQKKPFTTLLNLQTEYALSDNDRAGFYDSDLLANLLGEVDIDTSLYAVDLSEPVILASLTPEEVTEDEPPAVDTENTYSEYGKVYQLGRHRLMCGDATKIEDVEKLMGGQKADMVFTDPPYGVDRGGGFGGFGGFGKPIARRSYKNDEWDKDRIPKEAFDNMAVFSDKLIIFGGNFYTDYLPVSGHWLVWDKKQTMPTFGDCELAWTNIDRKSIKKYEVEYNGLIGKEAERFHPTQKPLKLCVDIIKDYSKDDETVLDLFLGSGSTLIACEQTNRICYGMELDPKYTDVIRKRYWKLVNNDDETGWQENTPETTS